MYNSCGMNRLKLSICMEDTGVADKFNRPSGNPGALTANYDICKHLLSGIESQGSNTG